MGNDPKALELVHEPEITRTNKLLSYDFKLADQEKTGFITLDKFKKIVRDSRLLTPKEKNLIIRL